MNEPAIYHDVRQWLQATRQANGGQLADLQAADAAGSPWLWIGAALVVAALLLAPPGRGHG